MGLTEIGREKTFTLVLTDDVFTINYSDQVLKVSVTNVSAVNGSFDGGDTGKIDGKASMPVPIVQGGIVTDSAGIIGGILDGIIITAPPGCTLYILIQR